MLRRLAENRAVSLIGTQYDLFNFNCEHYTHAVQYNKAFSNQDGNGVFATLALAVIGTGFSKLKLVRWNADKILFRVKSENVLYKLSFFCRNKVLGLGLSGGHERSELT